MKWSRYNQAAKLPKSSRMRTEEKILFLLLLVWELTFRLFFCASLDFSVVHQCLETYVNPIAHPLKNLGKNVQIKNLGKNVYLPRPPDSY